MSETVNIKTGRRYHDYLTRLTPGRFTSPNGVESSFLFDDLSRTRSKRTSAHEITDANSTIIQDLGSGLQVFNMTVYFVGDSCDLEASRFFNSLFERYTPDKPGKLNHPRWGIVPVIPFGSPEQTESFSVDTGIARVAVEFRETASLGFSRSDALTRGKINEKSRSLIGKALDRANRIATSGAKAYSKFRAVTVDKVNIIYDKVSEVVNSVSDAREELNEMRQDFRDAVSTIGASPSEVLAQVAAMVETIVEAPQDTVGLFNQVVDMTAAVLFSFGDDVDYASTSEDVRNVGLNFQVVASSCLAGCAIAALNADYKTREELGGAVDNLIAAAEQYDARLAKASSKISGNILKSFEADPDVSSGLHGVIRDTQALLLEKSFSLRTRRPYRLTHPSDPLTETWTHYGDLAELDLFCTTNGITMDEFVEIPAGRELVAYVL